MRARPQPASFAILLLVLVPTARADVGGQGEYADEVAVHAAAFYGIEPNLRFQYSSSAGNGFLGAGWSLAGLSEIRRVSDGRGAAGSTTRDVFLLDGMELLPCDPAGAPSRLAQSPSCKYRLPAPLVAYTTRIESHRRIAFDPGPAGGEWRIWSTSGTLRRYASAPTGVTWQIASVEDPPATASATATSSSAWVRPPWRFPTRSPTTPPSFASSGSLVPTSSAPRRATRFSPSRTVWRPCRSRPRAGQPESTPRGTRSTRAPAVQSWSSWRNTGPMR